MLTKEDWAVRTSIARWGNSLALRLPKKLAEDVGLVEGATVDLRIEGDSLLVVPARKKYRLSDLLAETKPEARQTETEWGAPRGRETW
jgi:antitoxin MazE